MVHSSKAGGRRGTHLKVDPLLQGIASRLRVLRLKRGLTQWALGERGVSYKYYQRIEAGRANMTLRTLERVARALGASFDEIFRSPTRTDDPKARKRS